MGAPSSPATTTTTTTTRHVGEESTLKVSNNDTVASSTHVETEAKAVTLGTSSSGNQDKEKSSPILAATSKPTFPTVVTAAAEEASFSKTKEEVNVGTETTPTPASPSSALVVSLPNGVNSTNATTTTQVWSLFLESQAHQMERGRSLLEDRRGWFFHFRPRGLLESTLRIAAVQGSNIVSNFVMDQATVQQERADLVEEGKLTTVEAEMDAYEWERREWSQRWSTFPQFFLRGLAKYHAATLLMRWMEFSLSHILSEVSLDRLTLDAVKAAKRIGRHSFVDSAYMCLAANLLGVVADTTVDHVMLGYEYWLYYQGARKKKEQKKKKKEQTSMLVEEKDNQATDEDEEGDDSEDDSTAIVLSFALKYTQIWVTKFAALAGSALGGAVGTRLFPGFWGTGMGINLGDAMVSAIVG